MSRSADGITNLTTALTGERIVGLHRGLQILVHYCGRHDGLEMDRELRKEGRQCSSRKYVGALRYIYIYIYIYVYGFAGGAVSNVSSAKRGELVCWMMRAGLTAMG
jgi:hypothetical protein